MFRLHELNSKIRDVDLYTNCQVDKLTKQRQGCVALRKFHRDV